MVWVSQRFSVLLSVMYHGVCCCVWCFAFWFRLAVFIFGFVFLHPVFRVFVHAVCRVSLQLVLVVNLLLHLVVVFSV